MYFGLFVAIAGALAEIFLSLMISINFSSGMMLYWALNVIKCVLQDFFVSPIMGIGINLLLLLCARNHTSPNWCVNKINWVIRNMIEDSIYHAHAVLKQREAFRKKVRKNLHLSNTQS